MKYNDYDINKTGRHLGYNEFNKSIDEGAIILDVRNYYEGEVGKFENAIVPDISRSKELLPEIKKLLSEYALSDESTSMLLALSELNGDMDVLIKADQVLGQASASVKEALQTLKDISSMASQRLPKMTVNFPGFADPLTFFKITFSIKLLLIDKY